MQLRPRARLISIIGNELVSDELVAVVELVKNAFDADATMVTVAFEGAPPGDYNRIVITDNGIGMSFETVLNSWLEPGTNLKREKKASAKGRILQGAKGIGRFAAARLAGKLEMETRQAGSKDGTSVSFDWSDFDKEVYLDQISVSYKAVPMTDLKHGTRLTLNELKSSWSEPEFLELQSRLAKLPSPFREVKDFAINLDIPGYSELSGEVSTPALIAQPIYSFAGKVDEKGFCKAKLIIDDEKIPFEMVKLVDKKAIPECGPFDFEIRAWDRDIYSLAGLQEDFNMTTREVRQTLDVFSGVSIYRDGFRVYPYGEKGNDWLGLDLRSRLVPGKNLANNQIIAAIKISRGTNPDLEDRSNREGLIKNDAYTSLQKWFKEVLKQLEIERDRWKHESVNDDEVEDEDEYEEDEEEEEEGDRYRRGGVAPLLKSLDISDTVQEVQNELGRSHKVAKLIAVTSDRVKEGVHHLEEIFSRLLSSAGIGHLVDIALHEIGSPVGKLRGQLKLLQRKLKKHLSDEQMSDLEPEFDSMNQWLEEIISIRDRLDPQMPGKRGKATAFDVVDAIEEFVELYRAVITKQSIELDIEFDEGISKVKMPRSVLDQILANLIDNAIFWITRNQGRGEGGNILISIEKLKHGFSVLVSDDGPGVDKRDEDRIFEPYFSKKPEGIGLGLYIARLLIEPYGWIKYRRASQLGGACFEAVFQEGVGL